MKKNPDSNTQIHPDIPAVINATSQVMKRFGIPGDPESVFLNAGNLNGVRSAVILPDRTIVVAPGKTGKRFHVGKIVKKAFVSEFSSEDPVIAGVHAVFPAIAQEALRVGSIQAGEKG